jgi:hypothetical protein
MVEKLNDGIANGAAGQGVHIGTPTNKLLIKVDSGFWSSF